MNPTDPIEILQSEHRVIERVLEAIETVLACSGERPFSREFFDGALDFITNFADRWHHCKEEDRLFPMLEESGVPRHGGPIGCMLSEHEIGRAHVAAIRGKLDAADRGDADAIVTVYREAAGYCGLLREHIQKEDLVLFRMARQVLSPDDTRTLETQFAEAERAQAGRPGPDHYKALADRLLAAARQRVEVTR
jgi:hemerythrin-like domain-containing protein